VSRYVDPTEQLVTEILVRDIARSVAFYRALGFDLLRDGGNFVELTWEEHRLFLAEASAFDLPDVLVLDEDSPRFPVGNVRVMVPDVDECWQLVNEMRAPIVVPIGDRSYGLRDFTIADPDGFGVRFATRLERP
jgi:catechol 2,3-dioxygenase-like lactoylglutathione lyase family enzyme